MDSFLADSIVIIHFLFVGFVIFGGILLIWSKKFIILHLPAAIWGALIEFTGWICPLTPLENELRYKAGQGMYEGGFVENYILPVLYPSGLTRNLQIVLGILVLVINICIYWFALKRKGKNR